MCHFPFQSFFHPSRPPLFSILPNQFPYIAVFMPELPMSLLPPFPSQLFLSLFYSSTWLCHSPIRVLERRREHILFTHYIGGASGL
jgi:hypothetical protein